MKVEFEMMWHGIDDDPGDDPDDDPDGVIHCIVCNGATSPLFHHVSRINAGLSAPPISPTYFK